MDKWKTVRAANIVSCLVLLTRCVAILIIGGGIVFFVIGYYPATKDIRLLRAYGSLDRTISYDHLSVIPDHTLPISVDTLWVRDLRDEVKQLTGRQVTLLVSDRNYLDVLVNWLAHSILYASQPVDSILIIAFDTYTYHVLQRKGFHSVYIQPQVVANSIPTDKNLAYIWITRLTIIRLLNYWKYNVLVVDSDAVMMRNIQPVLDRFNTSDIITSGGYFPSKYGDKWNAPTMCMGVILIKSSPATEQLWLTARTVSENIDDQMRMNKALDAMDVRWKQLNDDKYYQGITSGNTPLRVTSLPRSVVCRTCGKKVITAELYIWHQRGNHKDGASKKECLEKHHVWCLKDNWNASIWHVTVTPQQWLMSITKAPTNASLWHQG